MTSQSKTEHPEISADCDFSYIRETARANPDFKPLYVPLIEARQWFGVSRDTIYRAKKAGEVQIYKVGNRSVLKVSEIQEWVECT